MKIFDGDKKLDIPVWITASDNVCTVNVHSVKLNDMHGEYLAGDTIYSTRTFNCSGNILTDRIKDVERERSRLTALLSDKELKVYRNDSDDIFYTCRLIGGVKTGYYNGSNIGRVFSFSFTLKALDPFGYGEKETKEIAGGIQTITIFNKGNYISLPEIEISNIDYVDGLLFSSGNSFLELNKKTEIPIGGKLRYKNGLLYLNDEDVSYRLSDKTLIYPLCFQSGENKLNIKVHAGSIKLSYHGRYK